MFKRKSRYNVAYTGVDHVPLPSQEPDSGATAAARSIGESLKKAQPELYGKPQAQQQAAPQSRNSSLLKRNSLLLSNNKAAASPKPQARTGAHQVPTTHRQAPHRAPNGSSIQGESTRLSSLNANNEARLRDLKLLHQPQSLDHQAPVKMIKKYIPTPNGIQVIEVPESSYKQELARSNSMRSGLAIRSGLLSRHTRTPSLNSASGHRPPKVQQNVRKSPGLRLSSFTNQPSIAEEPDMLAESREETIQRIKELAYLKSELEKERLRAKELEQQRLEYEQLESLRAQNEKMYKELQTLREKDQSSEPTSNESPLPKTVDPKLLSNNVEELPVLNSDFVDFSNLSDRADEGDDEEEDVPITHVPLAVDEVDLKHAKNGTSGSFHRDSFVESAYTIDDDFSSQEHPTFTSELEVLETYEDQVPPPLAMEDKDFGIEEIATEHFDSPKLVDQQLPTFEPPAIIADPDADEQKTVLPTFDPVPEVIKDSIPIPNVASSIRSISSIDSKSKPIKSAMKNSNAKPISNKQGVVSPAEQAYLSLTTAENTRLNSKLSASQLNGGGLEPKPTVKSPPPSVTNTPLKRMSQTLRKQPSASSNAPGGMSNRAMRPRRHSDIPQHKPVEATRDVQSGGMSSRKLRTEPQPIAPHPAMSPNYQSPSKQKAAALYAKANSRPISHFEPSLRRKSSFSREAEHPDGTPIEPPPKPHMQSLRSPVSKPSNTVHNTVHSTGPSQFPASAAGSHPVVIPKPNPLASIPKGVPPALRGPQLNHGGNTKFRSKIVDSDDEDGNVPFSSSIKPSRFVDSDDETPAANAVPVSNVSNTSNVRNTTMRPLRESKTLKKDEPPKEEKKKKKKLLKKLFGLGK